MLVDLKKGNILVTGGAGFMGSAFIRYLLGETPFRGKVINLDLLTYSGNEANLKEIQDDPRYHFVQGDIRDAALIEKLYHQFKWSAIVNFAAETHVDRSIKEAKPFIDTNVVGTSVLLDFVKKHPEVHFHQISTDEVYGVAASGEKFTEQSPYKPSSPYAASKAAADHLVRSYARTYGISTTISHSTNNYGPYQFPEKLIPLMTLRCIAGSPLPIYGKGDQVRDWLYVEDHARAVYSILEKGRKGESYNVGGKVERKNIDIVHALIDEISNVLGEDSQRFFNLITHVDDRPGHDFRYALDTSKIEKEIGFWPKFDLNEGIYRTVNWYLDEKEWIESSGWKA